MRNPLHTKPQRAPISYGTPLAWGFGMECSLCHRLVPGSPARCPVCSARLDPDGHEHWRRLEFVRDRLSRWYRESQIPGSNYMALSRSLKEEMSTFADDLRREEVVETGIFIIEEVPDVLPTPPAPNPPLQLVPRVEPRPIPAPRPVRPPVPEAPAPRPDFFKNLANPRNIKWLLNLGIFIFAGGLSAYIYTEWTNLTPIWQMLILFGGTAAILAAGHALRRTLLSVTGRGLIALGTIALPIDFFAVAHTKLFPDLAPEVIGLSAAISCAAVYVNFARLYRDRRFSYLALIAILGIWTFGCALAAGWAWTPATLPPLLLLAYVGFHYAGDRFDKRLWMDPLFFFMHGATAAVTGWMLATPNVPWAAESVALACGFAFYYFSAFRTGRDALAWIGLPFLLGAFAKLVFGLDVPMFDVGRWLVYFGLLLCVPIGVRRVERLRPLALPLVGTGITCAALGLAWSAGACAAYGEDALRSLVSSLVAAGSFALAASFATRSRWPAAVALPMLAAAGHFTLVLDAAPLRHFPPYYAALAAVAAAFTLSTRRRFDFVTPAGTWMTAACASVALVLMAFIRMTYYNFYPGLGFWTCTGAAIAFAAATRLTRSRFLLDITYFAIAGAYVFALTIARVPTHWMGIACVALAAAFFATPFKKPSLFVSMASAMGAVVYGVGLYLQEQTGFAAATMLAVSAYLVAAQFFTKHKWLGAPAVATAYVAWFWFLPHGFVGAVLLAAAILAAARFARDPERLALEVPALLALAAVQVAEPEFVVATIAMLTAIAHRVAAPRLLALQVVPVIVAAVVGFTGVSLQTAMLLALAAGFFALVARDHKPVAHAAVWLLAAAYFYALRPFDFEPHWLGLAYAPFCILGVWLGRRSHAAVAFASVMVAVTLLLADPRVWEREFLGPWIAATTAVAAFAAWRREAWFASFYAALAYCVTLKFFSHESIWGGPLLLAGAAVFCALPWGRPTRTAGVLLSIVAMIYGFQHEPMRGWTFMLAGLLYFSQASRHVGFVYAAAAAIGAGDSLLVMHNDFDPGFYLIPSSVALMGMAWDLTRRHGREFGAPMGALGVIVALVATALVWDRPLALALHLAYDSLLFAYLSLLAPAAMYASAAAMMGSFGAFMVNSGMGRHEGALAYLGIAILTIPATRREWFAVSMATAMLVTLFDGFSSVFYMQDTRWGIAVMLGSALLYGLTAWRRRLPAFWHLCAASTFFAYALTCHELQLHEVEYYTIPLGVTVLFWSRRTALDLIGCALLLVPSVALGFDRVDDYNALAAVIVSVGLVVAGMTLRRRVFLLGGSFAFVAVAMAKVVQVLIEAQAHWAVWALLVGVVLIVTAGTIERIARGKVRVDFLGQWD